MVWQALLQKAVCEYICMWLLGVETCLLLLVQNVCYIKCWHVHVHVHASAL